MRNQILDREPLLSSPSQRGADPFRFHPIAANQISRDEPPVFGWV